MVNIYVNTQSEWAKKWELYAEKRGHSQQEKTRIRVKRKRAPKCETNGWPECERNALNHIFREQEYVTCIKWPEYI